jgi:hypothetical protein
MIPEFKKDITFDIHDSVMLCNGCGAQFHHMRAKPGDPCSLADCCGILRIYSKEFAAAINTLDRVGFKVASFSVCRETDTQRKIDIQFADYHWFSVPVPAGFELSPERKDCTDPESPCRIYKAYRQDMPIVDFARQLAHDKATLAEWIYELPLVKTVIFTP